MPRMSHEEEKKFMYIIQCVVNCARDCGHVHGLQVYAAADVYGAWNWRCGEGGICVCDKDEV